MGSARAKQDWRSYSVSAPGVCMAAPGEARNAGIRCLPRESLAGFLILALEMASNALTFNAPTADHTDKALQCP